MQNLKRFIRPQNQFVFIATSCLKDKEPRSSENYKKRFFLLKNKTKNLSYYRIKSLDFKNNFLGLMMSKGLKLKTINILSDVLNLFFFFIKKEDFLVKEFTSYAK